MLLGEVLQQVVQLHTGASEARADSADGDAEHLSRFLVAEALHIGQENTDAQAVREHRQHVFQPFIQCPGHQIHPWNIGGRGVGLRRARVSGQRQRVQVDTGVPPAAVVQVVDKQIGENAKKPGPGARAVLEAAVEIGLVGTDQRVLGQILRPVVLSSAEADRGSDQRSFVRVGKYCKLAPFCLVTACLKCVVHHF